MNKSTYTIHRLIAIAFIAAIAFTIVGCEGAGVSPQKEVTDKAANPPGGDRTETIQVNGQERSYVIHIPPDASKGSALPAVLVFHGTGGSGAVLASRLGLDALADRDKAIVVYPNALGSAWNDAERNEAFVVALINRLVKDDRVDATRVFAAGISSGAVFTNRLGCDMTEKLAAIAAVSGQLSTRLAAGCKSSRPIPVLYISGTADPVVPYNGGKTNDGTLTIMQSVADSVKFWREKNGCSGTPEMTELPQKKPEDGTSVTLQSSTACKAGASVVLYMIKGGGHGWPGDPQTLPVSKIGKVSNQLNASEEIWNFFINKQSKHDGL